MHISKLSIKLLQFFIVILLLRLISTQEKSIQCLKDSCYSLGGNCNSEGTCTCLEGYLTDKFAILKCDYKQTSAIKAGLIELATGFGIGHFYAGRKLNGLLKFFIVAVFCTMCSSSLVMIKKIREEVEAEDHPYVSMLVIIAAVMKVVIVCWQILDGVLFFLKFYKDGRDFPLY
jgi:hypothetical protein